MPHLTNLMQQKRLCNSQTAGLASIDEAGGVGERLRERCIAQPLTVVKLKAQGESPAHSTFASTASLPSTNDDQSAIQPTGPCRFFPLRPWHAIKDARLSDPKDQPIKRAIRIVSMRWRKAFTRKRTNGKRCSSRKPSIQDTRNTQRLQRKHTISDLGRHEKCWSKITSLQDQEKVIKLDMMNRKSLLDSRTTSKRLSWYDPEIIRRFAAECEAILSGTEIDSDRFSSSDKLVLSSNAQKHYHDIANGPKQYHPAVLSLGDAQSLRHSACTDDKNKRPLVWFKATVSREEVNKVALVGPPPPTRKSSRKHVVHHHAASFSKSTLRRSQQTTRSIMTLCSRNSEDLLNVLPQGPLPYLPPEAATAPFANQPHEVLTTTTNEIYVHGSSEPAPENGVQHGHGILRDYRCFRKSSRGFREIAASKNLSIQPVDFATPELNCDLPSVSSRYSQTSFDSQQSTLNGHPHSRHDVSTFRADRLQYRKELFQKDRDREKATVTEENPVLTEAVLRHSVPPRPLSSQNRSSTNELESFSPVSASFLQSLARVGRHRNGAESHVWQSSHANARTRAASRSRQYQALGKSDIKILVDTDPTSARFRAGAMSVVSSRAGTPEETPFTCPRTSHQASLHDVTVPAKQAGTRMRMRNLKGQDVGRKARFVDKPYRCGSVTGELNSEYGGRPPSGMTKENPIQSLRRQLQEDIQAAQTEYPRVEKYYDFIISRLERELREQREEIQMMANIMRAHVMA